MFKKLNKAIIYTILLILFYYIVLYFLQWTISSLLVSSLPFEQQYDPNWFTVFLYLFPIVFVFIWARFFETVSTAIIYILFMWFLQALWYFPFLSSGNYYFIIYLLLLLPIISLTYFAIYKFLSTKTEIIDDKESVSVSKGFLENYWLLLLFPILIFLFNLIPWLWTTPLIWADVYYHAPITESLNFTHPFFFEVKTIIYPKIWYIIVYFLRQVFNIDNIFIRKYLSAFFWFRIYIFLLIILKNINIDKYWKLIWIILLFPLLQFFLVDGHIRIIAYFLLVSQLFFLVKRKYILAFLFLPLIFFTHYEIGIHSTLILVFYFLIDFIIKIKNNIFKTERISQIYEQKIIKYGIIVSCVAILWTFMFMKDNYPMLILRNDIPLSLFSPVWIISFLSFFGFLIYIIHNRIHRSHFLLIAIVLLSTDIFFFFIKDLWVFYHRYFLETAYIGMCFISWFQLSIIFRKKSYLKYSLTILLAFLLIASIYPRLDRISSYKSNVNDMFVSHEWAIKLFLKNNVSQNVILVNPNNYINRFIPLYSHNYIFAWNFFRQDNPSITVLSFCWWSDAKDQCYDRFELSNNLFLTPTKEKLEDIMHKYRVDYLLLSIGENETFMAWDIKESLEFIDRNNEYFLYKIIK